MFERWSQNWITILKKIWDKTRVTPSYIAMDAMNAMVRIKKPLGKLNLLICLHLVFLLYQQKYSLYVRAKMCSLVW